MILRQVFVQNEGSEAYDQGFFEHSSSDSDSLTNLKAISREDSKCSLTLIRWVSKLRLEGIRKRRYRSIGVPRNFGRVILSPG